jgi:hypothetical protein
MYNLIKRFATFSTPFFFLLNVIALLIGGLWLIFEGLWVLVLFAFIISLFVFKGYTLIMLPIDLLFMPLLTLFTEKQKKWPTIIIGAFVLSLNYTIYLIWVIVVNYYATSTSEISGVSPVPFLFLGWFVATGSFSFVACKESIDNTATFIGLLFLELSYITLAVLYIMDKLWLSFPLLFLLFLLFLIPNIRSMNQHFPGINYQ